MKQIERGFTLLELLIVTAIVGLIANGAVMSIFQVVENTESSRNEMAVASQVQDAGYRISLDAQKAQTVEAEGLSLSERAFVVSWEQHGGGFLDPNDVLYFALSDDGGSTWSSNIEAFHGSYPDSPFSYTIPEEYISDSFKLRFYLDGFSDSGYGGDEFAYIDNINISRAIHSDDCSSFADWNNGNDWDIYSGQFRGHHYYDPSSNRYLTMSTTQDLSSYLGETVTVSWEQDMVGGIEPSDGLYFAFSSDNGSTWGSNIEAFHYYPPSYFSYPIPQQYLTDGFRMRFYLDDTVGSDEYLYIDNIAISIPMWSDDCSSFNSWDEGDDWGVYSEEFGGHHYYGLESDRYLTMTNDLDLIIDLPDAGFPLTFTWVTWSGSGGSEHEVVYSITGGRLIRSHSVDGGAPTETLVAQYIDPTNTGCQFDDGKLTLTVTATLGTGSTETSETREFQIFTRPDQ